MDKEIIFEQSNLMEVSIIIPCYNLGQYIERCLTSILSQSYDKSAFEIIVVADSCTDETIAIAERVLRNAVNYKIIPADCRRPGLARNIGLEAASGEYIWFIDGDDYLINIFAFKKLKQTISSTDANVIYMPNFESDESIKDDFAAWHYFYRRDLIDTERFGRNPIDEDWEFTKRVARMADYREISIEDKFYHYTYPREGSIMTEYLEQRNKNIQRLKLQT